MSWSEWKIWWKQTPATAKWFVVLVLIRPIADNLYYLKNISAILSPLYIIGVATPLLCLIGIARMRKAGKSRTDRVFGLFSIAILLSTAFFVLNDPLNLRSYEFMLKLTMPIYLYYFLRKMIRSKKDLDGILQTFLYSALFVMALFLYEVLINPIAIQVSRGLERVQGGFGDVMNYAIYISFGFLIMVYKYLQTVDRKLQKKRLIQLVVVTILCVVGLVRINHTATIGVFGILAVLALLYSLRVNKGAAFIAVGLAFTLLVVFGWDSIWERLNPLVETDLAVYQGELDNAKLLHGRVGRWKYCMEEFAALPIYAQFLGMPLHAEYSAPFVGVGVHNDYLRILFLGGFFGLLAYLALLTNMIGRIRKRVPAIKYLTFGSLAILLLYSITTTPTFYPPFMYLQLSILAYLAIPRKRFN